MPAHESLDAADLLRTGHVVVRVLAEAQGEADAYPALLEAIGTSLGSAGGAMWLPVARATHRRAHAWGDPPDAPDEGLSFDVPRIGVMNFSARVAPDAMLLETMHSLGLLISHFAERCRAQRAVAANVADASERERVLRHLATEQAALRRVATAIATESDPRNAFAVVTEEVGRLLRAPSANMIRFNEDETATVLARWHDTDIPVHEVGATVPLGGDSVSARVYRSGAPARVDSYEDLEGELAASLRQLGHNSAVAGPIFQEGRLWGAVIVSGGAGDPFPRGAEQRITSFAELAGQALASAQAREDLAASRARIVQAGDDERRRLERNLHDGAQQRLVSLALMLRLASRRHPDDVELVRAGEELNFALQELRELARGIHPAVLTERGLEPAVRAVADRAPMAVELNVVLDERLPGPVEAAAYYVVAEALTNVAKYAQASEVSVGVERTNAHARIEVRDDGVGGASPGGGTGLRGLADRVEALGGRFEIDSPAGAGTTLRAEIPVAAG
ncbi:GAF domain-containing protein [Solirubrobacter phytolaccae]|uniref:histidine kinase n=1 Tax=Solirubrobacter phytolaccae TaxID=1404360 RepID=A0A9X3N811_9ACTN|nr:GAF domain-containing protein [Solirubrobacter phytolaccae]MDA0181463.1 GAF domain-containing protein [Solirubrobacter phytolaccae]